MKFSTAFIAATREYSTWYNHVPAPAFRRTFTIGEAKSASLTICGLGNYELFINGIRITRGLLSPYIANPDDILPYDTYNLLPYLNNGENVIGVLLGNGMLNSFGGQVWEFDTARFRSAPKLALTFEAILSDDSVMEFDASSGFKCAPSPIILDDIRVGEWYDATKEIPGWNTVGFDDSAWNDPIPAETPRGDCRLTDVDPILPVRELAPVEIRPGKISEIYTDKHRMFNKDSDEMFFGVPEDESGDGWIYDFGVNAAGNIRLHIKNARPGQKLVLQFAEETTDDGNLDLRGMSFLPYRYCHRDMYICKGGDEVWSPMFTYHGFRYVLVLGLDEGQATPDLLTYVVMNSALRENGTFHCSDEVANKLFEATLVSDYANFYHFPTDCPHREKNGWTADAALSTEQMLTYMTPERNYREWLHHIRKSMKEDGSLPGIVPTSGWGFDWGNGPAWDTILVTLPYYTWLYRGNTAILRENATALMRYINYITTRRDEKGLIHIGLGDWCPAGRGGRHQAPLEFTDTVMCVDICRKSAKIFEVLGMKPQQAFAEAVMNDFRDALRKYMIDRRTMTAIGRCQSAQAMAIYYDIFDDGEKPAAFEQLVKIIEQNNEFIDGGVLGLRVLFHVLSEFGRTDLAYKMITRPEFPSYGNWLNNKATALWESFRPAEGSPNSHNHHFFGDIISWFMKHLVGIQVNPYAESVMDVRFAPKFIAALDHASGSTGVPAGKISAEWHREGDTIVYTASVPAGMRAEITLEPGYKFDDGLTWKMLSGTTVLRIAAESADDRGKQKSVR